MDTLKFENGFLVRLDRGEEITATLERFLQEQEITGGTVTGLGGIEDAELGFFDLSSKTYDRRTVSGNLELIHYSGNISQVDGRPFIHAHAVVSGPDYAALAGHFFQARIAVTGEFTIQPSDWKVVRTEDEFTGLKLIDFGRK